MGFVRVADSQEQYIVKSVRSGESFSLESGGRVMLRDIETPEPKDGIKARKQRHVFNSSLAELLEIGMMAKVFLEEFVKGQEVLLEFSGAEKDQYERYQAYVWFRPKTEHVSLLVNEDYIWSFKENGNGEMNIYVFLNALLLREGFARVEVKMPKAMYYDLFLKLEKEARENKRGIWK